MKRNFELLSIEEIGKLYFDYSPNTGGIEGIKELLNETEEFYPHDECDMDEDQVNELVEMIREEFPDIVIEEESDYETTYILLEKPEHHIFAFSYINYISTPDEE